MSAARLPLYWKVCLINGVVFVVAAIALVVSPATVSSQVTASELIVLTSGLALIVVANALLVRSALAPVDRLVHEINQLDTRNPDGRLAASGNDVVLTLARSFNGLLDRWALERSTSGARAIAAQERERQRIAQELHDGVGQRLTVVLLGLKRALDAAPTEVAEELALVRDNARASLNEVKRIAQGLRPGVLADLGLGAALEAMATDFQRDAGLKTQLSVASDLPELSRHAELVVFRIAQEALTNVVRHSNADEVHVTVTTHEHGLVLDVTDNGDPVASFQAGAGVAGMRERAFSVGGAVTLTTPPTGGVHLHLFVPTGTTAP
jgi:two-component system sensor histidine kinase UhpB